MRRTWRSHWTLAGCVPDPAEPLQEMWLTETAQLRSTRLGCSSTPSPDTLLSAGLSGGCCNMTSSRVWPVAGGRNSCIFSFCDLMNGSFRTAGQQQSCRAAPLLTAEGPRRTTNCLHTAGKQEEINQAKRRFSLRNRPTLAGSWRLNTMIIVYWQKCEKKDKKDHTCCL